MKIEITKSDIIKDFCHIMNDAGIIKSINQEKDDSVIFDVFDGFSKENFERHVCKCKIIN